MERIFQKELNVSKSHKKLKLKKRKLHSKKYNRKKGENIIKSQSFNNKLIIKIISILFLIILFTKSEIIIKKAQIEIPPLKVAMCAIAKKENRYIKYFIKHYKDLEYNHFYLYDNNLSGRESLEDVEIVKDGVKEGYITIIDYKNIPNHPQMEAYYSCYENYNKEYDWISFYDIDEFLILKEKRIKIQHFVNHPRFNNCDNIKVSWKVYNDNEQLEYEDRPLIERFPTETEYLYEERHIKSTVRGGLDYHNLRKSYNPHNIWTNLKSCTSSGKPTDNGCFVYPPDFETSYLNHYNTKTIREYYEKTNKNNVEPEKIPEEEKQKYFKFFFTLNKKTKEKVDIFNQLYHTNYN